MMEDSDEAFVIEGFDILTRQLLSISSANIFDTDHAISFRV